MRRTPVALAVTLLASAVLSLAACSSTDAHPLSASAWGLTSAVDEGAPVDVTPGIVWRFLEDRCWDDDTLDDLIVVLSVKAAEDIGKGSTFSDQLWQIGVLGVVVLLLGATAWLLRVKEREPAEGEIAAPAPPQH